MVARLREKHLLSGEHFTVDETLLEAWAGATSFQRKDGNREPPEGSGSNLTVDVPEIRGSTRRMNQRRMRTRDRRRRALGKKRS